MGEIKINIAGGIEFTVSDEVTMEKFGKKADETTMGEYVQLLEEALKDAPFRVDKIKLVPYK